MTWSQETWLLDPFFIVEVTLDKLFSFSVSQFPHLQRVGLDDHESLNQESSMVYQLGLGFVAAQSYCAGSENSLGTHIPPKECARGLNLFLSDCAAIYALGQTKNRAIQSAVSGVKQLGVIAKDSLTERPGKETVEEPR